MIKKKELDKQINLITYDILDNVISHLCNIPKGRIWADPFMADISCYTQHTDEPEEQLERMIKKEICKRYGIKSLYKTKDHFIIKIEDIKNVEDEEFEVPICTDWSLASIALYILLYGDKPNFHSNAKCDICSQQTSTIIGPNDNLICLDCAEKFTKGEIE